MSRSYGANHFTFRLSCMNRTVRMAFQSRTGVFARGRLIASGAHCVFRWAGLFGKLNRGLIWGPPLTFLLFHCKEPLRYRLSYGSKGARPRYAGLVGYALGSRRNRNWLMYDTKEEGLNGETNSSGKTGVGVTSEQK